MFYNIAVTRGVFKAVCEPNAWRKRMNSCPLVGKYSISGIWYLQYLLIKLNDLCWF